MDEEFILDNNSLETTSWMEWIKFPWLYCCNRPEYKNQCDRFILKKFIKTWNQALKENIRETRKIETKLNAYQKIHLNTIEQLRCFYKSHEAKLKLAKLPMGLEPQFTKSELHACLSFEELEVFQNAEHLLIRCEQLKKRKVQFLR